MPELVAYVAPESVPAKLPEMTNTKVEVKSVIIEKHSIPDLPKADMPDITITKYDTPDFKSTALPTAIIPDVTHSKYRITSYNVCYTKLLRSLSIFTSISPKTDFCPRSPTNSAMLSRRKAADTEFLND